MWINFKFLHMTDVEKSEISFNMCTIYGILLHLKLFCCKICVFLRFTLFCRKIGLLRFTRFCVEKILAKNSVRGEKMTNIRYVMMSLVAFDLVCAQDPRVTVSRPVLSMVGLHLHLDAEDDDCDCENCEHSFSETERSSQKDKSPRGVFAYISYSLLLSIKTRMLNGGPFKRNLMRFNSFFLINFLPVATPLSGKA